MPRKVHLVKATVFPVVRYGCESWIIKNAEHRRIDAFELWIGEDTWESLGQKGYQNQSILKEISPKYSMEGLMLKLKLHDNRGWEVCISPVLKHMFEQAPGVADGQRCLACCSPWGRKFRHNWATELNCQWKTTFMTIICSFLSSLSSCCIFYLFLIEV